jgi:hypothetical protein
MNIGAIDFPQELIDALRNGKLAIFAGTGVSMGSPSMLPDFYRLANKVAKGTGESLRKNSRESIDRFLGWLETKQVRIRDKVIEELAPPGLMHSSTHTDILRLFGDNEALKIVTTNFDMLFESAARSLGRGEDIQVFTGPALPRGIAFSGLVHLHGSVKHPDEMILTDTDFGKAYITEGWASRFLIDLFSTFTTLFVGYSHDDPMLTYLARALTQVGAQKRFVLAGEAEAKKPKWENLGIIPVIYPQARINDFSHFAPCLDNLATFISAGFFERQADFGDIARGQPPLELERIDRVLDYLRDPALIETFTKNADSPEWFTWLLGRGQIDRLFSINEPLAASDALARWVAVKFAIVYPDMLIVAISDHNLSMSQQYWNAIVGCLVADDAPLTPENCSVLGKWVTVLLHSQTKYKHPSQSLFLAKKCESHGLYEKVLEIFLSLVKTTPRFRFLRSFTQSNESAIAQNNASLDLDDRESIHALGACRAETHWV